MFSSRRSCCFLCQTQNHSSVRVTTSRKQERTQEERSVLLNNNRWICLLPFARKPDPGRVSKQVSRELPQAWLFGLVRLAPQAERKAPQAEFSAPQASQFSTPQARKFTRSAAISLLFSLGFRSRCSRRAAPPAARCAQRRTAERGRKLLVQNTRKRLWLFFHFTHPLPRVHEGKPRRPTSPQAAGHLLGRPSVALLGRRR